MEGPVCKTERLSMMERQINRPLPHMRRPGVFDGNEVCRAFTGVCRRF